MKYYQELTLIPQDEDWSPYLMWSQLYIQLHLAFVEHKDAQEQVPYGVSFPQYRLDYKADRTFMTLGAKLRIFAHTAEQLEQLNMPKWLDRLLDYVHVTRVQAVPQDKVIGYLTVSRNRMKPFHPKRNASYAARRGMSESAAHQHFIESSRLKPLPFITLKSLTNGQVFSLNIDQKPADEACQGMFSTFGFSATSTVPHWKS
ncbi:MAG: type I-F CRISPR-associated endoribonuclease Cas6/Csy4 [Pseudomonadota bacterium]|nr:type I-F CRISPR-associated endoribonuclease Cas6/Csy4 [Pseudomonadota bacterium]